VQNKALSLANSVSTLAGASSTYGTGVAARFNHPAGGVTDGTSLYVADVNSLLIRRIR
jgi:hypothetical protein